MPPMNENEEKEEEEEEEDANGERGRLAPGGPPTNEEGEEEEDGEGATGAECFEAMAVGRKEEAARAAGGEGAAVADLAAAAPEPAGSSLTSTSTHHHPPHRPPSHTRHTPAFTRLVCFFTFFLEPFIRQADVCTSHHGNNKTCLTPRSSQAPSFTSSEWGDE